ncbi:NAD(P)-dependent oxidoreductase [Patescibacteria group bacterium]
MKKSSYKIGIVGLGIMGGGMADNFLKNGYDVYIWNRTKKVTDRFVKNGALKCETPKQVASKSDIVFEVTANDESSKSVWLGKKGILAGADKQKVLIISATVSIDWVDKLSLQCKKSGYTFFDMALTGGRIGAESGGLTLLCGGKKKILEKIKPTLKSIASKMFLFGPAGQGMRYKLILNFIQAVHMIGFGEAIKIAKAHNMNLEKVGDALVDKPGGAVTSMAWRDYRNDPDPINFAIKWITKDLTYAKKMAKKGNDNLLNYVLSDYKKAVKKGFSDRDWASISKLI